MSNLQQCDLCRKEFTECPYYTTENENLCKNYELPIDNSRMFSHWYTWKGRIGRLEYIITIFVVFIVAAIISEFCLDYLHSHGESIMPIVVMGGLAIISRYLIIVAGIRRCHDSRASIIYAFLISCLSFSPLGIVGVVAAFYLFIQKGEEEINKHGSVPQQPYKEQIYSVKNDNKSR